MAQTNLASYKDKRVLITGGTGFMGQCTARALADLGAIIYTTGTRPRNQENYSVCDITDASRCREVIRAVRPHHVIHLAATINRSTKMDALQEILKINFYGTQNILEACRLEGETIQSVVFLGTSDEYGEGKAPFKETDRENPQAAYGLSKLCATQLIQLYSARGVNFRTAILRPFIIYGPGQPPNMLIPSLLAAHQQGEALDVSEGSQKRDFVFVDDVIEAMLLAGINESVSGEIFNVGSGYPVPVREVMEELIELSEGKLKINFGAKEMRATEIMLHYGDITKIHEQLGWKPKTSLKEGLAKTFAAFNL